LNDHIDLLRAAFREVRARHPFTIEATVILPDHLHAIWTLQEQDADFALRWRLIKSAFSHGLMRGERISTSRVSKGERRIWQRRYWKHTLRDQDDFSRHLDYIHFNPVKHGYAPRVQDWPYSSFLRWVRLGAYPENWAGDLNTEAAHLGNDDGFRCAQPILRLLIARTIRCSTGYSTTTLQTVGGMIGCDAKRHHGRTFGFQELLPHRWRISIRFCRGGEAGLPQVGERATPRSAPERPRRNGKIPGVE
jgi:putative transposase